MTTLHDRLAELADEAPVALPAPGLWERGRRYRKLRRTGTAAIVVAACLALVVLSGVTWLQSTPPSRPAPAGSPVGLPDRIWAPSPWLAGTDDAGPLGQLVAVVPTERGGWTGKDLGLVGIPATTGEYRFLDLPDAVPDAFADATLAPDGRHVAYWLTGETAGSPNTGRVTPVVGVAVYDVATGDVRRHLVPTEHGLEPEVLLWADSTRLVVSAGQILGGDDDSLLEQSQSRSGPPLVWSIDEARPRVLDLDGLDGNNILSAGGGRLVVDDSYDGVFRIVELDDPAADRRFVVVEGLIDAPVLDHSARMVAVTSNGDGTTTRLPSVLAGPVASRGTGETGAAELHEVTGTRGSHRVLAWLDDQHVAVVRSIGLSRTRTSVFEVAVATGESRKLVRLPATSYGRAVQFATDLLNAPSVQAEKPQSPLDPRLVAGFALVTVAGAGWALVRWRRRVQP